MSLQLASENQMPARYEMDQSPLLQQNTLNSLPADAMCPPRGQTGWPWSPQLDIASNSLPNGATWPKISIVTPSYNQGSFLEKTIRSVLMQGYPNLEYIVIDGGSRDDSVEIIKKYETYISYWVSEKDRGQSDALNKGFGRTTGELLGWLNSDDYLAPGALHTIAAAYVARPDAGAFVGYGDLVDGNSTLIPHLEPARLDFTSLLEWGRSFFCQPSCFFTKTAWAECGPLDEGLHYAMDLDLWLKIAKKYGFVQIDKTLSTSLVHTDAKTATHVKQMQVDVVIVMMRHGGEQAVRAHLSLIMQNFELCEESYAALLSSTSWKMTAWLRLIAQRYSNLTVSNRDKLAKIYRKYHKLKQSLLKKFFGKKVVIQNSKFPENKPLISVIIPCFNYGRYIDEAIESVLSQTFNNYEIIVVDGGSSDHGTIAKLKSIAFPKVNIYFREGPHLVGDNRNFGIARAQGKYICCLDADDKLCPTYLEKALFFAETHNYDIVYPWVQSFGNKTDVWAPWATDFSSCLKGANLSTVALFKREAWECVGGFRDWGLGKEHVPEDWDFWTRLLGHGFRAKMLPEPLMLYRVHGEGLTAQNRMNLRHQREKIVSSNHELFSHNYKILRRQQRRVEYLVNNPFVNLMGENREKINVLLALPFMVTGGADEVLLRILGHLSQKNFAFSCITTLPTDAKISGDNSPRYEKITPEIYHLHKFLHEKQETKDFIFYLIEKKRIDIIFIVGCSFIYHMIPEIKNRYPHVKIVDQLFNPFGHIINNRRYSKSIDLNIVANDGIEKILVNRFREKKEKVKVIIHGVDVSNEFCPERFQELFSRNPPWKLQPDDFVVGFFGRFSKEKCPVKFVDIAARLKDLAGVTWVMTGGGDEFARVRSRIVSHGLEKSILTPGIVADVKPFLAGTHVVVIPSLIEGIPIVLMEAMSLGIPVVASRVGGIPDVIRDGHNGFLCTPGDIDAFAARIKLLHDDRSLWETMGENAREFALNHLDVRKMLEAYHQEFINVKNQS